MFALIMLFLCVILHTMSSGKRLQLLSILPFGMLCLSAISMMFVKIQLAVCMLVGTLPCVRYYVFVKSSFKHNHEECESKKAYVF